MLKHRFLKFSYEFSEEKVNFLDMTISLEKDNSISTTLYQKPMNKHEFVHFDSNHPRHLLKSLPFSCGLRIKRTCSNTRVQEIELNHLMIKFRNRGYPLSVIQQTLSKLAKIDRNILLMPKSSILVHFLTLHNPNLLHGESRVQRNSKSNPNNIYITIPYSNRTKNLSKCVVDYFYKTLNKCPSKSLRKCIDDINVKVAYSVPNAIRKCIDKK